MVATKTLIPGKIIRPGNLLSIIDKTINKSIQFTPQYLESKLPGHSPMHYIEISNLLKDIELLTINALDTITNLGNGAQNKINKLSTRLLELQHSGTSFHAIKQQLSTKYLPKSLFSIFSSVDLETCYTEFTSTIVQLSNRIPLQLSELSDYQKQLGEAVDKLKFYYSITKLLTTEIIERSIFTKEEIAQSTLATRVVSINNSITVASQLQQLVQIQQQALNEENENINNYLNVAKIAFDILLVNNKSQFTQQFKTFLKEKNE